MLTPPSNPRSPRQIDCTGVSVEFGSKKVLDGVDLKLDAGSIVSLLGKSGCGKSTLLKAIAGLIVPATGAIRFTRDNGESDGKVSLVFQDPNLLPWRTVLENVLLPLELTRGNLSRSDRDNASSILSEVGLDASDQGKLPSQLSGGMRMRASLARALVTDPDVLLFDEPFAALDDMLRNRLNSLLIQLWQERPRTILFVTHNISEAVFLSHRVAIMGGGKLAKWIEIDLPFPREAATRADRRFAELYGAIASNLENIASDGRQA